MILKNFFLVAQLVSKKAHSPLGINLVLGRPAKTLALLLGGLFVKPCARSASHPCESLCLAAHRWFLTSHLPWQVWNCSYGMEAATWKNINSNKIFKHLRPVMIFSRTVLKQIYNIWPAAHELLMPKLGFPALSQFLTGHIGCGWLLAEVCSSFAPWKLE